MSGILLLARDGPIATVSLSHPEKLNALTAAMWRELARVMNELSAEDDLRCVALRGAGARAFAAGADIAEFARVRDNVEQGRRYHREVVHGALEAVGACRHPTLAMIHGPCVGGGLEIACQCDLRISGESGRFGVPLVARWHKQFVRRLAPRPEPLTEQELEENFAYFNTEDYRIGFEAFIGKKKPKFLGR